MAVMDHFFGAADDVGEHAHGVGAFWVGDDSGVGIFFFDLVDAVAGELDVDVAGAFPEIHLASGLFHDPRAEVLVGNEEDGAIFGCGFDDFDGVAAGADAVAEGFDSCAAVDVGDDVVIFICVGLQEFFELWGGAALF